MKTSQAVAHFARQNDDNNADDEADGDHDGGQYEEQQMTLGRWTRRRAGRPSGVVMVQTSRVVGAVVAQLHVVRPVLQNITAYRLHQTGYQCDP